MMETDEQTKLLGSEGGVVAERGSTVEESFRAAQEALDGDPARQEALRDARASVYMYQFWGSAGWGIWNTCYTYYLTEVGGYSSSTAANYATQCQHY